MFSPISSEDCENSRGRQPRSAGAPSLAGFRLSCRGLARIAFLIAATLLVSQLVFAQTEVGAQPPSFTEYRGVSGAYGIAAGADGAIWFTERAPGKIGVITPSGTIAEYALPSSAADPRNITAGPDGALWFTEGTGNKIGRITTSGSITEFAIPSPDASAQGIVAGPDGALWFVESNGSRSKIGRITVGGSFQEFTLVSDRSPNRIAVGPDGALWFTSWAGNRIGRITTYGAVTEYVIPTANSGPIGITAGSDGALWFTENSANKIGRITTSGVITEYPVRTSGGGPVGITAGPDGAIWFTESGANKVGRITTSGVMSEYLIPSAGGPPAEIAVGPDGALWIASNTKIIRLQLPKSRTGGLCHIAAGGAWVTEIALINTSITPAPVTVMFRGDDGQLLTLPVTTTQRGSSEFTNESSVTATINPNSTVILMIGSQLPATVTGWADLQSVGPVNGFVIFRQTPSNGMASEGTVLLQSQFPNAVTLPYDNTAGFVTGVAIANMSGLSAYITATAWDENGNRLAAAVFNISANGHVSFTLPSQIGLSGGKRGLVRFQSSSADGIAVLGLRFSPYGTFTSVPVIQ